MVMEFGGTASSHTCCCGVSIRYITDGLPLIGRQAEAAIKCLRDVVSKRKRLKVARLKVGPVVVAEFVCTEKQTS